MYSNVCVCVCMWLMLVNLLFLAARQACCKGKVYDRQTEAPRWAVNTLSSSFFCSKRCCEMWAWPLWHKSCLWKAQAQATIQRDKQLHLLSWIMSLVEATLHGNTQATWQHMISTSGVCICSHDFAGIWSFLSMNCMNFIQKRKREQSWALTLQRCSHLLHPPGRVFFQRLSGQPDTGAEVITSLSLEVAQQDSTPQSIFSKRLVTRWRSTCLNVCQHLLALCASVWLQIILRSKMSSMILVPLLRWKTSSTMAMWKLVHSHPWKLWERHMMQWCYALVPAVKGF